MKRYVIQSEDGMTRMLNHLDQHPQYSVDWEFHLGEGWTYNGQMHAANFGVHDSSGYTGYYVPLAHKGGGQKAPPDNALLFDMQDTEKQSRFRNYDGGVEGFWNRTKPLLEDPHKKKLCHAAEIESGYAAQNGVELGDNIGDSQIMAWLYDENKSFERQGGLYPFRLKDIAPYLLGKRICPEFTKLRDLTDDKDISGLPIEDGALYGTNDAIYTLMLNEWFEPELKNEQLWDVYNSLEIPMVRVLRDMMRNGIHLDLAETQIQRDLVVNKQTELEKAIYAEAGYVFNVRSRQQLAKLLFEEKRYRLKDEQGQDIPPEKTAPSKNAPQGNYVTNDTVMYALAKAGFKIPVLYREHGDFEKLRGTYLQKFLDVSVKKDHGLGLYYPSFWQCGTLTGRYSSDFQQVPKRQGDMSMLCKCGRDHTAMWSAKELESDPKRKNQHPIAIRMLVVPYQGRWLIVADFNQLELRILAHYSEDPVLMGCYRDGDDLHQGTADAIIEAGAEITRNDAKPVNFGLVYGLTEGSMIEMFGEKIGKVVFAYLMRRFAGMLAYKKAVIHQAHLDGFIRTLAWRKRRVHDINNELWQIRSHAERQAFNSLIQGSAADIVKMAQLALYRKLPEARQVLQVHDELLFEFAGTRKAAEALAVEIKHIMETVVQLVVPLVVDPSVCTNWRDGK